MNVVVYITQNQRGCQVKTEKIDNKGIIRKAFYSPMLKNKFLAEDFLQKVNLR